MDIVLQLRRGDPLSRGGVPPCTRDLKYERDLSRRRVGRPFPERVDALVWRSSSDRLLVSLGVAGKNICVMAKRLRPEA